MKKHSLTPTKGILQEKSAHKKNDAVDLSVDAVEHKKLAAALKEAKDKIEAANKAKERVELTLNNIIASMPGHVYWKNVQGVYLGCNDKQAQSLGLQYGREVIGKTDFDLPWTRSMAQTFKENDLRIIEMGKAETFEENALVDGKEATVLSQKTPLKDEQGIVIGILGISLDITERKEYEIALKKAKKQAEAANKARDKAEAANKAKTEFLENMRHDIRTPLTGIAGVASMIKDEVSDLKMKKHIDDLIASSYALLDLLNEILEAIKVSSGNVPLLRKKFELKKRLSDVIQLNKAKALHKNIDLIFEYDENIPAYLIGDSTRIHRIALELIANALNFTDKGVVKLTTQLAKNTERGVIVKLVVEDTGMGIALDKQQEIFLHFKRLTPSYEGVYKGTGLGLAIVKNFLDEIDGEVYVESQLGVGTKLTCLIPLKEPLLNDAFGCENVVPVAMEKFYKNFQSAQTIVSDSEDGGVAKHRILVVEDQVIAAMVVKTMLSALDCQVDVATNGQLAIELAQKNNYDLIFMDIGLPDTDGYEITKRIRLYELSKGVHIPIIALTAHGDEGSKQRCIEVGMNTLLIKPLVKEKAEKILNTFIPYRKKLTDTQHKRSFKKETSPFVIEGKVIDVAAVKQIVGDKNELVQEMLGMLKITLSEEVEKLQFACEKKDWPTIQAVVHKIKGDSSYCGAARLKEACIRLEASIKNSQIDLAADLYKQMFAEIRVVEQAIEGRKY